jgi:hypothetical protein
VEIARVINTSLITVLEQLQASWQSQDKFSITSDFTDLVWRDDHPLASQLSALRDGKPCSLPYFGSVKVSWVTFGGNQEELLEAMEDLRCWLLPYLGKEESTAIVTIQNAQKPQERVFCATSGWYFRWYCPMQNFKKIAARLKALSSLLDSRPTRQSKIAPSLNSLRLDFVAALRTGEWIAAKKAVDLIDQWQLDTARNTQLMRIRMLYEEGDFLSLVATIKHNEILDGELPSRLRELVIDAIYQLEILPIEQSSGWQKAFDCYQSYWQSKLSPHVIAQRSILPSISLSAYQAYSERDYETLHTLFESCSIKIAGDMLNELPERNAPSVEETEAIRSGSDLPPSIGRSFWREIETSVRSGAHTASRECIAGLTDSVLDDPEWISVGAVTLLEIFTDPLILEEASSMVVAEEVLLAIIDTVVNSKDFPRHEHALIYDSLISTWVAVRNDSSSEQGGQLLLGLIGAAIESSVTSINECEVAIRTWWCKRKILGRLPWLVAALEMLVQNHPKTTALQDLWIDGADLVSRFGVPLSKAERSLWRRLGRFVGIDDESVRTMIVEPIKDEQNVEIDPLSTLNLRKIAVVTLHERAAKQAAEELMSRTGAEVVIVTSTSANDLTRTAESADLILFVWAACTHAVYRSFDHVRGKLQYVQGTGPSSIVLAAERWAMQNQTFL